MFRSRTLRLAFIMVFLFSCSTPRKAELELTPEQKAKQHFKTAVRAIHRREAAKAIAELGECLKLDPENLRCRWELGYAHSTDLNFKEAERIWLEIGKAKPRYPGLKEGLEQLAKFKAMADAAETLRAKSPKTRKLARTRVKPGPTPESRPGVAPSHVIRLVAVGDTMIGSSYPRGMLPPEGPEHPKPLEQVRSYLDGADLRFVNLEGTICDGGVAEKCLPPKKPDPELTPSPTLPPIPGVVPIQAPASPVHSAAPIPSPSPIATLAPAALTAQHVDAEEAAEIEADTAADAKAVPDLAPSPSPAPRRCYAFRTPTRMATYIKDAGFNLASLANNHIADFGDECRAQTEQTLDQLGIKYSGRPGTFAEMEIKGVKVAMVAFHSNVHSNFSIDIKGGKKFIAELRKKYPIVIVSFHGGAEGFSAMHVPKKPEIFAGEKRGDVMKFGRAMIDAGASLVIGHGPHVPRAMEFHKRKLIAYSLGNFATYHLFNLSGFNQLAPMLEVDLDKKGRFVAGRIIPFRQLGQGVPAYDERATVTDIVRLLSHQDFPGTAAKFSQDGEIIPPWESPRRKRDPIVSL